MLTRQCLDRRIDTEWMLSYEIICWELARNLRAIPISWSLDWKRAKRLFVNKPPVSAESTSQNLMVRVLGQFISLWVLNAHCHAGEISVLKGLQGYLG